MLLSSSLFFLLPVASLAKPFTKRWHADTRSTESAGVHIHREFKAKPVGAYEKHTAMKPNVSWWTKATLRKVLSSSCA